ncbi:glycosyltransferase family 2 protein [Serpula lacrymans var. lacrymans S7.3]|uniref:Glycosyltransferase family 2 protein n=2 Tax=Serpula lacrymans var. lacrymans TaxID=341189 RepID=F8PX41_SERL3|nr:glycosyltransferase family 2 protein [Serpula lacrymans var. lacrymans S7.3]
MWSIGDGRLVKLYPEHTYFDHAPNSSEILLISAMLASIGAAEYLGGKSHTLLLFAIKLVIATIIANTTHDLYRHLWRDAERNKAIKSTASRFQWFMAAFESSFIRMASEAGRSFGMVERGELLLLGKRFDWFTGRAGGGPRREERMNSRQRLTLIVIVVFTLCYVSF